MSKAVSDEHRGNIEELQEGGTTVLKLCRRLDGTTSPGVDETLLAALKTGAALIVDLTERNSINSIRSRSLLEATRQARITRPKLLLARPQPLVEQVFNTRGFTSLFALCSRAAMKHSQA